MMNVKKASGLAALALAGALLTGCGDKKDDLSARVLSDYEGITLVSENSNDVKGYFHEVFETADNQYIVKLGSSSWLIGEDGKVLTEGGHFIHRTPEGIFTGYGKDMHLTNGINTALYDSLVTEHQDMISGFAENPGLSRDENWENRRNALDNYYELVDTAETLGQENVVNTLQLIRLSATGHFERRDDGLYVKIDGKVE